MTHHALKAIGDAKAQIKSFRLPLKDFSILLTVVFKF